MSRGLWMDRGYWLKRACADDGQGMVEYALLVGFIALIVAAALFVFGPQLAGVYNTIGNNITNVAS